MIAWSLPRNSGNSVERVCQLIVHMWEICLLNPGVERGCSYRRAFWAFGLGYSDCTGTRLSGTIASVIRLLSLVCTK